MKAQLQCCGEPMEIESITLWEGLVVHCYECNHWEPYDDAPTDPCDPYDGEWVDGPRQEWDGGDH